MNALWALLAFGMTLAGGAFAFRYQRYLNAIMAFSAGLLIGVVESLGGLWLGESLGQIGIFLLFIAVLLFRPQGLFGARA